MTQLTCATCDYCTGHLPPGVVKFHEICAEEADPTPIPLLAPLTSCPDGDPGCGACNPDPEDQP